ncbi:MAG: hypothetical protein H7222_12615 [Methylotenera sp.]|nr:hypothetical protein [Oligoflexia bacterium]
MNLPQALFHYIREFESAQCQVTRRGNEITIRPPCWDMAFFPMGQMGMSEQLHTLFGDDITIAFDENDKVSVRFQYWKPFRIFLHVAATLLFGMGLFLGQGEQGITPSILGILAANLSVALITGLSLYPCLKAFSSAQKKAGAKEIVRKNWFEKSGT